MNNIIFNVYVYKDGAELGQLDFQDSASPITEQLIFFHDDIMFILVIILALVGWMMLSAITNKHYYKYLTEGTTIEII